MSLFQFNHFDYRQPRRRKTNRCSVEQLLSLFIEWLLTSAVIKSQKQSRDDGNFENYIFYFIIFIITI